MNQAEYISQLLGVDVTDATSLMDEQTLDRLVTVMKRPDVRVRANKARVPYGAILTTTNGPVYLDHTLQHIDMAYINGLQFSVEEQGIDAIEKMVGTADDVKDVLGEPVGRQKRGRRIRSRKNQDVPMEELQKVAFDDLNRAGITYDNIFDELGGLMKGRDVSNGDIVDELFSNHVPVDQIAHFLVYESHYKIDVISQAYGQPLDVVEPEYDFEPVVADASFIGQLVDRLGETSAEYDAEKGVLKINDRLITNLPSVDENGVFSNGDTRYLPYYIGYYAQDAGSRVERLRVIDPVESALTRVKLHYDLTAGDVKFSTLMDVSRNLPDFDTHPYGDEILATMKKKVVLDKSYLATNSLLADYQAKTDDLGAVALTMLDDDAEGLIDPYGTSNGRNMGVIFYLTEGAEIAPDGSLMHAADYSEASRFSPVGQILDQYFVDKDNFNRNQMSFNAFLTSTDVKPLNVAFSEFALWNSEDAVVLTEHGAQQFASEKLTGDKLEDFHGNKSTAALVLSDDISDEEMSAKHLEYAMEYAKLNPTVDMIVSPISLASRLNMGVAHEGLQGPSEDLHLPDGTVVKDGVTQIMYMSLPQTAEHKSKDYGIEGDGRRYSTLFRYALASKVGDDMYRKALVSEDVRNAHIDEVATAFQRLGVTFKNDHDLITEGNVQLFADAPVTVSAQDFNLLIPAVMRLSLMNQMEDGQINIDLGEMSVINPFTKEPIKDSRGHNVLPIRVSENGSIPYRYAEVFKDISLNNAAGLQQSFAQIAAVDYGQLTRKDNLLKHIDTMTFKDGAKTTVIIPDPSVGLGQVRSNAEDTRVIIHRDPAIQSGNTISVENVGLAKPNVLHVNPLMINQVDGDFDGDTMGENEYRNLTLTDEEKDIFFSKSSVTEQLNHYGEVFLSTQGSHFKAAALANGLDTSQITFDDGKSNEALQACVENVTQDILTSPTSYGAYSLSFTDEASLKTSLSQLSEDGIKGNTEDMIHHFDEGYTADENRAILKALIAKSEWTGLAGAITNNLIAGLGEDEFDKDLVRVSMDVTHSMTQSVLQMKKNADKLPVIDAAICEMKTVMSGAYDTEVSRQMLKQATDGLLAPEAVDQFVDRVAAKQDEMKFGTGVINGTPMATTKLAYANGKAFENAIMNMGLVEGDQYGL